MVRRHRLCLLAAVKYPASVGAAGCRANRVVKLHKQLLRARKHTAVLEVPAKGGHTLALGSNQLYVLALCSLVTK